MKCPKCKSEIKNENANIQTDIAKCVNCDYIFKISEFLSIVDSKFDEKSIPEGVWHKKNANQTILGATTKHISRFFIVPFMLVWSSGVIGGIYGSQFANGEFDPEMSLFGIPFILGALLFWSIALMTICGKVELTYDRVGGKIFTGVGKIGLTKKFIWKDISKISEGISNLRYSGSQGSVIVFEGRKRISFASGVNDERKYYLIQTLKKFQEQVS